MNTAYQLENLQTVPWIEVESKNLGAIAYLPDAQALFVRFKEKTTIWLYQSVPQDVYDALMDAPSKGSYFAKNIKGKFESQKFVISAQDAPVRDDNGNLHPMEAAEAAKADAKTNAA